MFSLLESQFSFNLGSLFIMLRFCPSRGVTKPLLPVDPNPLVPLTESGKENTSSVIGVAILTKTS